MQSICHSEKRIIFVVILSPSAHVILNDPKGLLRGVKDLGGLEGKLREGSSNH